MFLKKSFIFLNLFICDIYCGILYQNDDCGVNKQSGRCVPIENCHDAIQGIKKGIHPTTCGFVGKIPIVCCIGQNEGRWKENENSGSQNGGQWNQNGGQLTETRANIHEEKCKQFLDEINSKKDENKQVFYTVVGGTNAKAGEYPHMALLGYGEKNSIAWNCGGSLISKEFILTAAHCLTHPVLGEVKYVRLGDIYIDGSSKDTQNFQVIQRIKHPEYKAPLIYNDIALLRLDKQATFTDDVKPACFHAKKDVEGIPEVTATGWGLTEFGGSPANILQTVGLDIFNHSECANAYRNNKRRVPNGILDERQICAGGREREQDTCQGDSGGPLQWRQNGQEDLYKIIGVTSLGKGCGTISVPAIYTRVAHYIPWIEKIVFT